VRFGFFNNMIGALIGFSIIFAPCAFASVKISVLCAMPILNHVGLVQPLPKPAAIFARRSSIAFINGGQTKRMVNHTKMAKVIISPKRVSLNS